MRMQDHYPKVFGRKYVFFFVFEFIWQYASSGPTQVNWPGGWTGALPQCWYRGCLWSYCLVAWALCSISPPFSYGLRLLNNTWWVHAYPPLWVRSDMFFITHFSQLHQSMLSTCLARDTSFCLTCIHVWRLSLLEHSYALVIGVTSTSSRQKMLSRLVPYLMLRMLMSKSSRMVGTALSSYIVIFCSISL